MKRLLMIAAVAVLAFACNKNQQAVKKLDGTWNATELSYSDGTTTINILEDGATLKMIFDGCKLKNDEFCNLTTIATYDGESETTTSVYRVTNDGETLENKENKESSTIETMTIIELTKSYLELTQTEDGYTSTVKLEKQ